MGKMKFSKPKTIKKLDENPWKILIADDDIEIHTLTRTVLNSFNYDNRPIEMISSYSGKETIEILKKHDDIVLVLLDVVMETDDAGLIVVNRIRKELNNNNIQIILRTGQAGIAPESDVVKNYDINDYKEKTELTSEKLHTSILTAIRAYKNSKSS